MGNCHWCGMVDELARLRDELERRDEEREVLNEVREVAEKCQREVDGNYLAAMVQDTTLLRSNAFTAIRDIVRAHRPAVETEKGDTDEQT